MKLYVNKVFKKDITSEYNKHTEIIVNQDSRTNKLNEKCTYTTLQIVSMEFYSFSIVYLEDKRYQLCRCTLRISGI